MVVNVLNVCFLVFDSLKCVYEFAAVSVKGAALFSSLAALMNRLLFVNRTRHKGPLMWSVLDCFSERNSAEHAVHPTRNVKYTV